MKRSSVVLLLLSLAVGASAGLKDLKLQKPETAQVSGVVKMADKGHLVVVVKDGASLSEQSFSFGLLTQVKGANAKGVSDLTPGKVVNVTYDPKDRVARTVLVVEKKDAAADKK